ncbi:LysR family transcriptional regulator [Vibrio lentus]|uniref:LysR family transcriptional regulator n=1 Tax=Vibrio lentus TaxID=136468 RepID=UPI000CC137E5|nr:LysR family transcriptional regulator [Vibrio lentus]PMI92921.1 hypothetical protein BCU33_05055 [Vibrio lentus]
MKAALNKIDLNLLKVLHVLIEEQNVTHAAERLFLAQPSVSRKLRKLREQLDDELFVSTPQGMKPTYRCNQIAESLPDLIALLEKTLTPVKKFDAYSHAGHISLAINPLLGQSLPHILFLFLAKHAPNVTFSCNIWNQNTLDNLAKDNIQLGINYDVQIGSKAILHKHLAEDHFKLYANKSHPIHLKKIVEFEYLSECRFAIAQLAEWNEKEGMMENMLVQRGLNYNEVFRSEIISNVAAVAVQTEALFPTSELYIDNTHNLVEVSHARLPSFNSKQILLYQHKRRESDPFYLWLHENIVQLVDGLG